MRLKNIITITILLVLLIYVTNITNIPNKIILFEGENLNIKTLIGIKKNSQPLIQTSSENNANNVISQEKIKLSLFNLINLKDINVTTIENTKVIPMGNIIGLKLYANGVLVIGMTEIEGIKPYENTGLKEGDLIIYVNKKQINSTDELVECVNSCDGNNLEITYIRDGEEHITNIIPVKTSNKEYKLGLWVRDGASGIGTATYYELQTKAFAALGHGILDIDTNSLISIESGELVTANIINIEKGEEGKPGQIKGSILNEKTIGNVYKNTDFGLYGEISDTSKLNINETALIPVAKREEIETGPAKIMLTLEDGIRKEYDIEIIKIYKNNNIDNKSMLIKVTDKKLLELTGGIIQGMSGAPIIQNSKFIGAITHVFVNRPTEGYAVFGDLMIKQMKE